MSEANSNVLKDFTELHDNMVAELKKRIPQLDTVELYDPTEITHGAQFKINTPAILIELVEAKPGEALTGGRPAFDFATTAVSGAKSGGVSGSSGRVRYANRARNRT